jgi:hypothetical protein
VLHSALLGTAVVLAPAASHALPAARPPRPSRSIGDGTVVQRGVRVPVWGGARPAWR